MAKANVTTTSNSNVNQEQMLKELKQDIQEGKVDFLSLGVHCGVRHCH